MEDKRIGFIGIVLDDLNPAAKVNSVIGEYSDMISGRIGVPDHEEQRAVIGLLIKGDVRRLGTFTGRLGNIPGVTVKSAVTKAKEKESKGEE